MWVDFVICQISWGKMVGRMVRSLTSEAGTVLLSNNDFISIALFLVKHAQLH